MGSFIYTLQPRPRESSEFRVAEIDESLLRRIRSKTMGPGAKSVEKKVIILFFRGRGEEVKVYKKYVTYNIYYKLCHF